MNREVFDLVLLFMSAFVGATIAFLAALITFAFHHEIRERLVIPPHEPQPNDPTLQLALEHQRWLREGNDTLHLAIEEERRAQGLPVVRLTHQDNDPNRHLRVGDFPAAFAAWRNRNNDNWAELPDQRPCRLPTDGTIWAPHPQYIMDWDQPLAPEQQPIDVPPTY